MPRITATVSTEVRPSFRVEQVRGMFDLAPAKASTSTFTVELPELAEPWTIGAIVGPSGSGKSAVARAAFGQAFAAAGAWSDEAAVIDGFGEHATREIVQALTAVGFASPPAWLRPYAALSNGERFRCDLARALLEAREGLLVFDEFTSVVDRTVAQIGSAAVSRAIRSGRLARRFVAVTCHYDVLAWLEPDWVLDMATCRLTWGRLRRPEIVLEIVPCQAAAWTLFARHHYLGGGVPRVAQCYLAAWNDEPVAFCAVIGIYGRKGHKRITRLVTLPDFQGLGLGLALAEQVCRQQRAGGFRVNITASHPAVIGHCVRSPLWRAVNVSRLGHAGKQECRGKAFRSSRGRSVVSFEFVGEGKGEGSGFRKGRVSGE